MSEKGRILYSIDESGTHKSNKKEKKKKETEAKVIPQECILNLRMEKKGRGGKTVTVVFDLPHAPEYFKKLTKRLKAHCGCGGSFKSDQIEIQGDLRPKIKIFLEKEGFKVKG